MNPGDVKLFSDYYTRKWEEEDKEFEREIRNRPKNYFLALDAKLIDKILFTEPNKEVFFKDIMLSIDEDFNLVIKIKKKKVSLMYKEVLHLNLCILYDEKKKDFIVIKKRNFDFIKDKINFEKIPYTSLEKKVFF